MLTRRTSVHRLAQLCGGFVELIELRDHVVQRSRVGRHRQELHTGLVQTIRARECATTGDAEQLDMTLAIDVDGEHADRANRQGLGTLEAASGSTHVTDPDALTPYQDGPARRVCACTRWFQECRSSRASTRNSRRKQSVPATDIGVLEMTLARWLARPSGIAR